MSTVPDQGNHIRFCDFCNQSKAIIHCRADSANLCLSCDREVHSTNPLFKKHHRSLLCNSCGSSPCSIFCCAELVLLCQNCDWETHKGVSRNVHDRRPIEGFSGVPSVGEFLGLLGLDDDLVKKKKKSLDLGDENDGESAFLDMLVWETPMVVGIDDLIVGSGDDDGGGVGLKAMGVPPLPKNRNAMCGKDKDEIISQLRDMAKTEPNFEAFMVSEPQLPAKFEWTDTNSDIKNILQEQPLMPSYEENVPKWYDFNASVLPDENFPSSFLDSFVETNHVVPDKDAEAGDGTVIIASVTVQEDQSRVPFDPNIVRVPRELNSQERDSALSRYKEKKKTRRYEKHIRYESRKVRAEGRTRIKGRFAKMDR